MGPHETLTQVRAAAAAIQNAHELGDAVALALQLEALNEWLSNGGLRPGAWQR